MSAPRQVHALVFFSSVGYSRMSYGGPEYTILLPIPSET